MNFNLANFEARELKPKLCKEWRQNKCNDKLPAAAAPLLPEAEGASTVCHKENMSKLPPSLKKIM